MGQKVEKKSPKSERERTVLLGLVDYFLKTGKAVGSNTLKEAGFPEISSATIRNYFAKLEKEGYLIQQHTSGGRIPTDKAIRLFADHLLEESKVALEKPEIFTEFEFEHFQNLKEVALFLETISKELSDRTTCAAFISSPRFDHDLVSEIKLLGLDATRVLAVLVTNLGHVASEVIHIDTKEKLSAHALMRIEKYLQQRLAGAESHISDLDVDEELLAGKIWQEAMTRYLVSYANFSQEDVFRTGFSKLLLYPELQETESLASSLYLFENQTALRALIRDAMKGSRLKFWIGQDLFPFLKTSPNSSVVVFPYKIGARVVGAVGILGPMRIDYQKIFPLLEDAACAISRYLTTAIHKHQIGYRTTFSHGNLLANEARMLLPEKRPPLLIEHEGKVNTQHSSRKDTRA